MVIGVRCRKELGRKMVENRYVQLEDKEFWYSLDRHLPNQEFENKIREKRGYEQPMELFLIKGI